MQLAILAHNDIINNDNFRKQLRKESPMKELMKKHRQVVTIQKFIILMMREIRQIQKRQLTVLFENVWKMEHYWMKYMVNVTKSAVKIGGAFFMPKTNNLMIEAVKR